MDLVMLLEEWGYEARGPLRTPREALEAIEEKPPDLGILDVNLGNGETSLPIAEVLASDGIPFVFLTGYDPARYSSEEAFGRAPHLRKPVAQGTLRNLLLEILPQDKG